MYIPLKIKLQKMLDSNVKESITSMRITSSKSTLLTPWNYNASRNNMQEDPFIKVY